MSVNAEVKSVIQNLMDYYYKTFEIADTNNQRANLRPFYNEASVFTTEQFECVGVEGIMNYLTNLPIRKMNRSISSMDLQFLTDGSLLVVVTGQMAVIFVSFFIKFLLD